MSYSTYKTYTVHPRILYALIPGPHSLIPDI